MKAYRIKGYMLERELKHFGQVNTHTCMFYVPDITFQDMYLGQHKKVNVEMIILQVENKK